MGQQEILTVHVFSVLSSATLTFSASRSKITVEEPLAGLESENTETRPKLHGHDSRRISTNQLFVAFVKEALNL